MTATGDRAHPARDRLLGYGEAVAAASLWGSSGIFAVNLFRLGVPPESLALLRPLVGALILLIAVGLSDREGLRIDMRGLLILMAGGGISVGFFQIALSNRPSRSFLTGCLFSVVISKSPLLLTEPFQPLIKTPKIGTAGSLYEGTGHTVVRAGC